jgi:hypothetical protein
LRNRSSTDAIIVIKRQQQIFIQRYAKLASDGGGVIGRHL